jgi:MFS family permease
MITATEVMMEWANVGWRHFAVIGFVYTLAMASSSVWSGADMLFNHGANYFGYIYPEQINNEFRPWVWVYLPLLLVVPIALTGIAMMKFGRFATMMGTLGVCIALTPIGFMASNLSMWCMHVAFSMSFFNILFLGMGVIFIYESFPVRFRRAAILAMGIFVSLGRVFFTLAFQVADSEEINNYNSDYWLFAVMFSVLPLALPLLIGAIFLRKDTLPSLVDRGFESQVYDELVGLKKFSASAASMAPVVMEPPMCKAEFQFQVEAERLSAFTSFKNALIKRWPALVFLLFTGFNVQLFEDYFANQYMYSVFDYLGGGQYNQEPTRGRVFVNFFAIAGLVFGIFMIGRTKRITLLPGISASAIAIGAAILASVALKDEAGNVISRKLLPMPLMTAGVAIAVFGLLLAQFVQCIMIVEIAPSKYRPIFVMIAMAVREVWRVIFLSVNSNYPKNQTVAIVGCVVLFLIAIAHFVGLTMFDWISSRDPAVEEFHRNQDLEKAVSEYSVYDEGDKINDVEYYNNTASTKTQSKPSTQAAVESS